MEPVGGRDEGVGGGGTGGGVGEPGGLHGFFYTTALLPNFSRMWMPSYLEEEGWP